VSDEARVEVTDLQARHALDIERLTSEITSAAGLAAWHGLLSVALVDDERMQELHRDTMDIDEPTDVLAFPLTGGPETDPEAARGEIVISTDTAAASAAERGATLHVETLLYALHGLLHLLGHDDHDPSERERMQAEERRLLATLGYERPD